MTERYDDRPRTIPEMRGLTKDKRPDPEKPYSKESYAAQYGIAVEDAEGLRQQYRTHGEIKRAIYSMFSRDEGLRRRALMLDDVRTTTRGEAEALEKQLRGVPVAKELT